MKLVIDRSNLLKSLGHVQSVVEKRGTIPILANVKIEAAGDVLYLTATDMDIAVMERVAATVSEPGHATVPAHTLYDIIRKLPDGSQVEISRAEDASKAVIRSGTSRFSLATLPVDEFPVMSEGDMPFKFSLALAECNALIDKTRFAVSTEETRYYLNGIYLHEAESQGIPVLRAVATDGHRLARVEVALPAGAGGMPGIIIPRKAIDEIKKLTEGANGDVQIALSDSKIRVASGSAVLVSKLIDGTFPDYERVIPVNNDKIMEVDGRAFTKAVDRVSVISSEKTRGIRVALAGGKLTLSADSPEHGTATEEVDVNYSADPVEIGFNSRYLLDMMGQIEGEIVQFVLADSTSPALVRDTSDVGALYVIMPMRV
jgi:DNA polymerase III subunit beta